MQGDIEFNVLVMEQKGRFLGVSVATAERISFINNSVYGLCSIKDLARLLSTATDLKKICVLGSLTLLNNAGVSTESLREKGAIVSLSEFMVMFRTLKDISNVANTHDKKTLKTFRDLLERILRNWGNGSLAHYDQVLFQELNARAVNIMMARWNDHLNHTDLELVDILHKRINCHVEDQICAYLGEFAPLFNNHDDFNTDPHALIMRSVNRRLQMSDIDRAEFRDMIIAQLHSNYFSHNVNAVDLYKYIKKIRDDHIIVRYQNNQLSPGLSADLDAKLSKRILTAICRNYRLFAEESSALSRWIFEYVRVLQEGIAVDNLYEFNKQALVVLLQKFKSAQLSNELNIELMVHFKPLVEDLKLAKEEVEKAIVFEAVACITTNLPELSDTVRAQFVQVVRAVICEHVNVITREANNQAGRDLLSSFCTELLALLNSSDCSRFFRDCGRISSLFNQEEHLMIYRINNLFNNACFYQAPPVVGPAESTCPEYNPSFGN